MDSWNPEAVSILNKIRINSITLSNKHRLMALNYQSLSKYFDIPVIVISTFSSSMSGISLMQDSYKNQTALFLSMFITILTSIKLYLNITNNLNSEILLSREFYILSVDIYKTLNLRVEDRHTNAIEYLNESYGMYIKLCEKSSLSHKMKKDELLKIDIENDCDDSMSSSSSSSNFSIIVDKNEF